MKHTLLFLVTLFIVTYVHGQWEPAPDNRQYKDQYLLPEIMTNDNNCFIDFDIGWYGMASALENELRDRGYYCVIGCGYPASLYCRNAKEDFAQPYRTDTAITIIGLSGYCWYRREYCPDIPYYLELRDSTNNEIIRSVNVFDFYPPVACDTSERYKEVLFDTPINIKGKFYVVLHSIDSIMGDYDYYQLSDPVAILATTLCTPSSLDMYPLIRDYNSDKWTIFDHYLRTIPKPDELVTMVYLFPILGEYDPNAETYNGGEVGIEDLKDITDITHVFPNPAMNEVNINCGYKMKSIELYDEQGKLLYTKQNINAYNHKISLNDYPQGTYLIKILTQTGQTTKKIIKK